MRSTALFAVLCLLVSPLVSAQRRVKPHHTISQPATISRQGSAGTQILPIKRVILYSNGVAYFERRGTVSGHAEIALQFKQSQVDDVLKSMVVLDLGHGRVGAVSYNSSAPPSARLNDIPFSIDAATQAGTAGGIAGVLKQLQGARVAVVAGVKSAAGSVITVEERKSQIDANKPPIVTNTLVIAGDNGELTSFDLADVRSIKILDEGAKRDISQFADASASARRRDAKTIVVTSDGEGPREMLVSYTVAAPIWKTSYKVVLDSAGKPFFQGWAIFDNVSEEDWNNVSLSLVSGSPVSFVQPIQQPLYRYRPVVPIPNDLRLNPQVYEVGEGEGGGIGRGHGGGIGGGDIGGGGAPALRSQVNSLPLNGRQVQNLNQINATSNNSFIADGAAATVSTSLSDAITGGHSGIETAASGEEVGDLFEYKIDQPVTVPHDRSALIPILQTRLEGDRVSIYNESVRRDRPMSGLRLRNTSPLTLEDGSLTVIEGDAYAGEALIQRFKPGEQRLVSFALDLGTLVTSRPDSMRQQPVFLVRIVDGILQTHYWQTEKKVYKLINQTDRPRTVYIEHPIREGWVLSEDTIEPKDKTRSFYRFRVDLKEHETVELPITERRALMDSYTLTNLTEPDMKLFTARGFVDDSVRASLNKILEIKSRLAAQDKRIAAIDEEKEQISDDQERLRKNIEALKDTAEAKQLIARYVSKANDQETRIEQLTTDEKTAQAERSRIQSELSVAISQLSLEKKL
jgi:hypothetical protein